MMRDLLIAIRAGWHAACVFYRARSYHRVHTRERALTAAGRALDREIAKLITEKLCRKYPECQKEVDGP